MRKNRADGIKKIVSYNIKLYWNWLYDRVSSMIENEGIFNGICLSFIAVVSGVIDLQISVFAFQIYSPCNSPCVASPARKPTREA